MEALSRHNQGRTVGTGSVLQKSRKPREGINSKSGGMTAVPPLRIAVIRTRCKEKNPIVLEILPLGRGSFSAFSERVVNRH
ncbi:hypothetical protein CPAR01_04131 [Colletotrichum paranaense]|uniref:Uncharacterized protein n=2 Tax=Colletotrichum acutatum species complex TaxID=2707335 RepID=A0AAI9V4Z5_9PEZI|nr:uncharacterized protein CPAR01_04131 [Colletotrichum paranaense]XP_060404656.1 uncharacterized protein CABS01_05893 [Colletotrichum abscissum]KAI3530960.1 hypothetical protein CSPX01_14486 [Colletotrichum filicis]KAK1468877.1 hypothetical protein CMEL01_00644 [Colletotrichum melonis]KAK1518359.1 hypothetical protein CABS01_05893 [Colletotrichum abscissum]KAK1543498.1 hypothetical protein CPAR01_04131 [Colletotrichum paranaense]